MATIQNARDVILQATSPRLEAVTLPSNVTYEGDTSGNHTGNLDGTLTSDVVAAAFSSSGDITKDVLENSGTAITISASNLFTMPGTGSAETFIGAGGITAKDSSGTTTFSISASTGDAFFGGNVQADSFSTLDGNFLGSWNGSSQSIHLNQNITLSSGGVLSGAGGGSITNLSYGNVSGGPPSNADRTETILESGSTQITVNSSNLFRMFGSGSAEVSIGDAGIFGKNTSGSTTFSILSSNGQATFEGDITGGSNINIDGAAIIDGDTGGGEALSVNNLGTALKGIEVHSSQASGIAIRAVVDSGASNQTAVLARNAFSPGNALKVEGSSNFNGQITVNTQTISNLTVGNATNAAAAANATNANQLGGVVDTGWGRIVACDVGGNAAASGHGFQFNSTVSGTETYHPSGNIFRVRPTSDARLKNIDGDEKLGFDFIHDLSPKIGQYKKKPGVNVHFLIAQDVEQVLQKYGLDNDALVTTDPDDGIKGIDYTGVSMIMLKNLQDLEKRVKELESRLLSVI